MTNRVRNHEHKFEDYEFVSKSELRGSSSVGIEHRVLYAFQRARPSRSVNCKSGINR